MITLKIDAVLSDADWAKRTDDRLEYLRTAGGPGSGRYPKGSGSPDTQVGITSSRRGMTDKQIETAMREFSDKLHALPGVSQITVKKGTGIFFGDAETTWVTAYHGNGEARKLLAKTAERYNQDSVLIMKAGDSDASVELTFDQKISAARRPHVMQMMTDRGIVGGTWYTQNGRTVLRMASVKDWGGDKTQHLTATEKLAAHLLARGMRTRMAVHEISTEVIENKDYARVQRGLADGTDGTETHTSGTRRDGSGIRPIDGVGENESATGGGRSGVRTVADPRGSGGGGDDSEEKRARTLGGPGSGRYPKGSGSGRSLYHGTTPQALESIFKNGLTPDDQKHVWMTESLHEASSFAKTRSNQDIQFGSDEYNQASGGSAFQYEGVVLELFIPQSEAPKLEMTDEYRADDTRSYRYMFHGTVKPEWIRVHSRISPKFAEAEAGGRVIYAGVRINRLSERTLAAPNKKIRPFDLEFDYTNPDVIAWAEAHAAELIKGITETTTKNIHDAVVRSFEQGDRTIAEHEILDAVGDKRRAKTIAHHESMLAANEGQRQSWDQAIEEGLLTPDVRREWVATADQVVCPICESLDRKTASLNGEYPEPGGDGPPQHVNCRCSEGIIG